jgi:ketosteroid isomerase-like protein
MESARKVVEKYYAAFGAHRDGWKDLVTDDVEFVSPLQSARGKEEFVALSEQFQQFLRETRVLRRFEDGDSVCSICESVVTTPSGKALSFTYAEWTRVRAGRLSEFRIYYDPREFAKAFGIPA